MTARRSLTAPAVGLLLVALAILVLPVALLREEEEDGNLALRANRVDGGTLPAILPFAWAGHHLVIEAWLEDAGVPLGFMFDTGAPVIYAHGVADSFGSERAGRVTTLTVDGTTEQSPVVSVHELALGTARFRDVGGIVGWVEPDNPLTCVTGNGVVGASLMRDAVWRIDYAGQEIGIHASSEGLVPDGAIELGFEAESDASPSPIVRLPIEGGALSFLLDTGSDAGLVVNPSDLESIGLGLAAHAPSMSRIVAGASGTSTTDVHIANVDLAVDDTGAGLSYPVGVSDAIGAGVGNMGNGFLRQFVVTVDWPERMVYLQPSRPGGSITPPPGPLSATVMWHEGRLVVGSIVLGGPADGDGLELGDVVVAIDGQPTEALTIEASCESLAAEGSVLTTAGGQQHTIEIVSDFYDWSRTCSQRSWGISSNPLPL